MGRKSSTTWKPGQSGNPNGRPKRGESLSEILRMLGEERDVRIKGVPGEITKKEAVGRRLYDLALRGNVAALKYLMDRLEGRVPFSVDLSGGLDIVVKAPKKEDFTDE